MDIQIKKGLTDVCVLAVLNNSDSYGYQIAKDLSDIINLSETTLYPVLKRLLALDQIKSYEMPYNGRLRKYFSILPSGKKKLTDFRTDQEALIKIFDFINKLSSEEVKEVENQ